MWHASDGRHLSGQRSRAIWMQTTGAALLAVKRCSLARVLMPALDGRSARRLLYLAAVWVDWRQQEPCQGTVDAEPVIGPACHGGDRHLRNSIIVTPWSVCP
jgi:hypothetical protein